MGIKIRILLIVSMILVGMGSLAQAKVVKHEIKEGWNFRQARLRQWRTAVVPGTVHTDLMAHNLIEDPFIRLNERSVQWVDKEDWVYETRFDMPSEMQDCTCQRLVFKGLDTYADVSLNGEKILSADNLFREWSVDVTGKLRENGNILMIYFHSPIKVDLPKWEAVPFRYEAGNDQSQNGGLFEKRVSVFARKAGYHYGWDWGPRLVTSGIWRPVILEAWNDVRVENVAFWSTEVSERAATVHYSIEISSSQPVEEARVAVYNGDCDKLLSTLICSLKQGMNKIEANFKLRNPRLWWCNGMGEASLYKFRTELICNGKKKDTSVHTTGIRSIELIREDDVDGQSFYFCLNGVRVFAKGANYIPSDNFLPKVTIDKYEKTIADAVAVHMNMLRVWGGGIYENDEFYTLCDRYGLLVWQDFMFACSLYPTEGVLLENIRQEAVDNVKRLRNHPCMALWCGNNENQTAWFSWGWKEQYERQNQAYAETIWNQYCEQYFKVLPQVVQEYGLGVAYTPSSPFSTPDKGQSDREGDRHFWGVWNATYPISAYRDERSRFFSEYGFQSFPELASVERYAPLEEDHDLQSDAMMWHQRGGMNANERIRKHLLNEYHEPKGFENMLYMTQVLQADAVKIAMEAHRRDKPYCMGTLYWQINDCWPVASWSSRDYYGRWKALHYFVGKAFDDVLVSPIERDGRVEVWIVSDRRDVLRGNLLVEAYTMQGECVASLTQPVKLNSDESRKFVDVAAEQLIGNRRPSEVVITARFTASREHKVYTNNCFLLKQKDMEFPKVHITAEIESIAKGFRLTLRSDGFARSVCLGTGEKECFFTDNYFDILPGQIVCIEAHTDLPKQDFEHLLTIKNLRDAY